MWKKIISLTAGLWLFACTVSFAAPEDITREIDAAFAMDGLAFSGIYEDCIVASWYDTYWGIMDWNGEWIFKPDFVEIGTYTEGLAPARQIADSPYGYIDKAGKFILPPRYDSASPFSEGLAVVSIDGRRYYINKTGATVYAVPEKCAADSFSDGVAWIALPEQGYRLIDNQFNTLFEDASITAISRYSNGAAVVKKEDVFVILDKTGRELYRFDANSTAGSAIDDAILVTTPNGMYISNTKGEPQSEPSTAFQALRPLGGGYFIGEVIMPGDTVKTDIVLLDRTLREIKRWTDAGDYSVELGKLALIYPDRLRLVINTAYQPASPALPSYTPIDVPTAAEPAVIAFRLGDNRALVNGKLTAIDAADSSVVVYTSEGRSMLPVRFLSENMGYRVDWNEKSQLITLASNGRIEMTLGNPEASVTRYHEDVGNYQTHPVLMDVPPQLTGARTFVPLRFVSEQMGKFVYWDDRGLAVVSDAELNWSAETADALLASFEADGTEASH